jgi:PhzF family phenazine biosynthesis protein
MTETGGTTPPSGAAPGPAVLRYAAFTDHGGGGNPAGVVLDAAGLDDSARLAIAARVGYSETAFAEAAGGAGQYRIRYFSPKAEVAFCGHATIAATVAIAGRDGPGLLRFDTLAGPVTVRTSPGPAGLTATLTSVPTRTRPAQAGELEEALTALRWRGEDLDPRYPAHVAYAGNDHLIAVRDRARLAALDYDYPAMDKLMAGQGWNTVHLVQAENPVVFHARDPFPPGGVFEDPATGAAAAAFGGYLRALALVDVPARVTILQGQDMGRPSRLLVDLAAGDERVRVTGTADPIPAG